MAFQAATSSLEVFSVDTSTPNEITVRFGSPAGASIETESLVVQIDGQQVEGVDVEENNSSDALSVALVIDVSGSMQGEPLAAAKDSAQNFIANLPESAQISVVSFGDTAILQQAATTDRDSVLSAINNLEAAGETALFDGVSVALENQSSAGRNVIVALSDGGDTASQSSASSVASSLETNSTRFIGVALETDESSTENLEALAGSSGEVLGASNASALNSIYTSLATDLSKEFSLSIPTQGQTALDLSIEVDGDGGQQFLWRRPQLTISTEDYVITATEQPEPVVVEAQGPGLLGNPNLVWAGAGLIFFAILACVVAWLSKGEKPNAYSARLLQTSSANQVDAFNDLRIGATRAVEAALDGTGKKAGLADKLEAADIKLRVGEFVLVSVGVTALAALGGWLYKGPFGALGFGFLAFLLSRLVIAFKIRGRRKKIAAQLPDFITLLANALKAGYSLQQAVVATAAELEEPMASELQRVLIESRVGGNLIRAMRDLADRSGNEDINWVVDAIDINSTVGGDLVEVLESVGKTIRDRITLSAQVDALAAEGKMSAGVLFALPPGLGLVILVVNPEYFEGIWHSSISYILVVAEVVLMGVGAAWLKKMVSGVSL